MAQIRSQQTACVVAGIDLNGLGVLRSLGKARVPLVALDTDLAKPTLATRFGTKVRVRALSGPEFVDELLVLRRRFASNPVLILTQEASVATVSAARERLIDSYRFSMPKHALMEQLLDKKHFHMLAQRHGFPVPRTVYLSGYGTAALRDLRFPCVLKPPTKHAGYAAQFIKAYRVANIAEVEHLWLRMREVIDSAIVQEWIEGTDADVYFCLQYRCPQSSVSFVGRKLNQWPPLVGGTATCMPAPDAAAALTALTDRFFEAVGFVGICSMEYKRDARDGRFYMVEPTVGRTDFQEEVAVLNGVNIPLAAYRDALGEPPPIAAQVNPPRVWRDPLGYAKAKRAGAHDPMHELAPGIKVCDAYFRTDDPGPYVALQLEGVRRRLSRMLGRSSSSPAAEAPVESPNSAASAR